MSFESSAEAADEEQLLGGELVQAYNAAVAAAAGLHKWQILKRAKAAWNIFQAANQETYVAISPERAAPPVNYYELRNREAQPPSVSG